MNRTFRIYGTRIKNHLKSFFTRIRSENALSEAFIGKSDNSSLFLIIIFKVKVSATKVLASQSQKIENRTRIRHRHSARFGKTFFNFYKIQKFDSKQRLTARMKFVILSLEM